MIALYQIHDDKTEEPCGMLWLGHEERERLKRGRYLQLLVDKTDGRMLALTPDDISSPMESITMHTVVLSLDIPRPDTKQWRIYCIDGREHIDTLKTIQESKMRFPVPISLFPG
jgi:hypothetical protein